MPPSIVQFDNNVRKHYQMGLVTVEALRGVGFCGVNVSTLPHNLNGKSSR